MPFEEVESKFWTYEKEGDSVEGILIRVQDNVGANKSKIYNIETKKNGIFSIWGSTLLDSKMLLVKLGDLVKITYKGLESVEKEGKNKAKLFSVMVDKSVNN
jgi:hypothetical protein